MMTAVKEGTPERYEQVMSSLELANRVRRERLKVYRQIRDGKITMAEALEHKDVQTATIAKVISQKHRWGDSRVRKLLIRVGVRELREVRLLTERQKREIVKVCDR
jgi:hypothetical protein